MSSIFPFICPNFTPPLSPLPNSSTKPCQSAALPLRSLASHHKKVEGMRTLQLVEEEFRFSLSSYFLSLARIKQVRFGRVLCLGDVQSNWTCFNWESVFNLLNLFNLVSDWFEFEARVEELFFVKLVDGCCCTGLGPKTKWCSRGSPLSSPSSVLACSIELM